MRTSGIVGSFLSIPNFASVITDTPAPWGHRPTLEANRIVHGRTTFRKARVGFAPGAASNRVGTVNGAFALGVNSLWPVERGTKRQPAARGQFLFSVQGCLPRRHCKFGTNGNQRRPATIDTAQSMEPSGCKMRRTL